jgi:hypothetical protein
MYLNYFFTALLAMNIFTGSTQTVLKFKAGAGLPFEFSEKTSFSPYYSSPLEMPIQYGGMQVKRDNWNYGYPINFEFGAEVAINKKSFFGFHTIFNCGAGMGYSARAYELVPDSYNPGGTFLGYYGRSLWYSLPLQKFYFSASRRIFGAFYRVNKDPEKKKPAITLEGGLAFGLYRSINKRGLHLEESSILDNLVFEDRIYVLRRLTPAGMCFLNMRVFGSAKHEICSIRLSYEQGFQKIASLVFDVQLNNLRTTGWVYTRGSGFSVNLTFPVFSYNFTQKKFYRD